MGFYDTSESIEQYVEMARGYDGAGLIKVLQAHVASGSAVLELGMGPGVDLDILAQTFEVTGSDTSQLFLDRYKATHPEADLMPLDATTLDTERRFDAVYSNKVLHHLTRKELRASLEEQLRVLKPGGIALHSLWWGEKDDEFFEDVRFVYHTEATLRTLINQTGFEIAEMERYTEMESDDSIWVVLRAPADSTPTA